jgi:NAD(P)-dependent dehydrogenase (short-subunit alcohol dehydrogenase family)
MNPGTVVLITGCSSGFGLLMAETLARKNYHVFATMRAVDGRNAKAARAFRTLAERESLHLDVLELDVTDSASVERAVDVVIAQTDRIDVLINNAGYGLLGLIEACTLEQAQRIFDTNFFGVVRMNRAVLPYMRRHGSGLLVHISSGAGRVPMPGVACTAPASLRSKPLPKPTATNSPRKESTPSLSNRAPLSLQYFKSRSKPSTRCEAPAMVLQARSPKSL